ncbi:MAG: proprotein convertase P-domain-containing protein [Deltaproteobacteria bacterium]|nr:proprotein convertase P-domain-containing protein [Deltaproteobacteria bacterium]
MRRLKSGIAGLFGGVVVAVLAACSGTSLSTGIALTVTSGQSLDPATPIDDLQVQVKVGGGEARERSVPLGGRPLSATETVNLLFDPAMDGQTAVVRVDALQAGVILASGRTEVTLKTGKLVAAVVELSRCAAALGDYCDGEQLVTCDPQTDLTRLVDCPYGCNPDLGRCNLCAPGSLACQGDHFVVCDATGSIANEDDCIALGGQCRTATCTPDGCAFAMAQDGAACDDNAFCSDNTVCSAGTCSAGTPKDCGDGNPCTFDTCDELGRSCRHDQTVMNGLPCSDGSFCLVNKSCAAGACAGGTSRSCDDGNTCTVDSCDELSRACVNTDRGNGANCDDGDYCSVGETCSGTVCGGGSGRNCNDANPCTTDSCDTGLEMCANIDVADSTPCDDGTYCVVNKTCVTGVCGGGAARVCNDGNACTADYCDENAGTCRADPNSLNGAACTDGSFCLVSKSCSNGACAGGTLRNCDDGNACTTDSCDEPGRTCANADRGNGANCDDGDYCSVGETCSDKVCGGGSGRTCDDANPCTSDSCDTDLGMCVNTDVADTTPCNDGTFCVINKTCVVGACGGGAPRVCDDGNACTFDSCDESGRQCSFDPGARNGAPCDNGAFCTVGESCGGGGCGGGAPRDCADTNSCTLDTCNETANVCDHTDRGNGAACDDGRFCTVGERCTASVCGGGNATCDDGNACTTDGCDDDADVCTSTPVAAADLCLGASQLASCDGTTAPPVVQNCSFGCNAVRKACNECSPSSLTCQGDLNLFCYAEVTCGADGRVSDKTCCASNRCTCTGNACLEDACVGSDVVTGDKGAVATDTLTGTTCGGADNIPGDCSPGGTACRTLAGGGSPEAVFQMALPDTSDTATTFYKVVLDSAGSAFDTTLRLSTMCTSELYQFPNAGVCETPTASFAVGASCAGSAGVKEKLTLCGVPEGTYYGAVDGQPGGGAVPGLCGDYSVGATMTPVIPDTDTTAGNISKGGIFRGTTCGLADNYSFPDFIATTCARTDGNCYRSGTTVYCPSCGPGAATDCTIGSSSVDGLCGFSGGARIEAPMTAGSPDAVFYLALPVGAGVDLSTEGSRFDTVLYLEEAGANGLVSPGARRICNDDCTAINGASHIQTSLPAGLYYVVVDGAAGACGEYTLTVEVSPAATCGDLICTVQHESCTSCPVDCPCLHCGDGGLQSNESEKCDDGNRTSGDGCSATCAVEPNYWCRGVPSLCYPTVSYAPACPLNLPVLDPPSTGASSTLNVPGAFQIFDMTLDVNITHSYTGDVTVNLVAPDATSAMVHNLSGGSSDDIVGTYDTTLIPDPPASMSVFDNRTGNGLWRLEVKDLLAGYEGVLNCWGLTFVKKTTCGSGGCEPPQETCGSCADCNCAAVCGNGLLDTAVGERCDDGNTAPGDGCSGQCVVESSFWCTGTPSVCRPLIRVARGPNLNKAIPDADPAGITDTINVGSSCTIRDINVDVNITHTWKGDLLVQLTGPSGTKVTLHNHTGSSGDDIVGNYDLSLQPDPPLAMTAFDGKGSAGSWVLFAADTVGSDTGTLNSWAVNIICN